MKYIDADRLLVELEKLYNGEVPTHDSQCDFDDGYFTGIDTISQLIDSFQEERSEMDLNDFTQKMNDWKIRHGSPYSIPIKATMAFTARMFYTYPNIAREWYESLPKATQD